MTKYLTSAAFIIGVSAYIFFGDFSGKTMSFLSYKNPYSRKPASFELAVQKKEENVEKATPTKEVKVSKIKKIELKIDKINEVVSCYQKDCDFADTDSREYGLSVGQALKSQMMELYEETLKMELESSQIEELGAKLLAIGDGHVKEAAILLLSTQPPSQMVLDSLIENVIDYHDPNLIGLTLIELEKYNDEKYKIQIRDSFMKNFKEGSLLVKEALAKGLYRFVSEDTRGQFQDILENLPKNSRVRNNLKSSLDRFDHTVNL